MLVTKRTSLSDDFLPLLAGGDAKKGPGAVAATGAEEEAGTITVPRYDFDIQFVWKEKPLGGTDDKQKPG